MGQHRNTVGRSALKELLNAFVDILLLRRGPQDLPASRFLLACVLAAYVTSGMVLYAINVPSMGPALAELAVVLGLEIAFFAAVLALGRKLSRAEQTFTALWGTGAMLTLAGVPLHLWMGVLPEGAQVAALPGMAVLALLVWSTVVGGHILREALEINLVAGVMLVLAEFVLSIMVTAQLFGGGA